MKILTLEDYELAGQTFWPKYWYIAKELGEDAQPEQVLKVMEAIGAVSYTHLRAHEDLSTSRMPSSA